MESWNVPRERTPVLHVRRPIRALPGAIRVPCPYCQREFPSNELRRHTATCRLSPPASSSDQEDQFESDHLTIRSQFVSANQSQDLHLAASLPLELPRKPVIRLSATRPPSAKKPSISCPVCFNDYNRTEHVPLLLPACGHTLCEPCARHIYNAASMAKCPVCRAKNYEQVRALPINYAILELSECPRGTQLCQPHEKEVLAYCADHDQLLCGLCVFEHRDHNAFLLTSDEAKELVEKNKQQLGEVETRLETLHKRWVQVAGQLDATSNSSLALIEAHSRGLCQASEHSMAAVRSGKEACIKQLNALTASSSIGEVQSQCAAQMHKLTQDLQTLRERKSHYDQLTIVEKLSTALSFRAKNYAQPPSLQQLRSVEEQLKGPVDYQAAVQAGCLFPSAEA